MALISMEHHLEKLHRQCEASWYGEELNVERSNSVLEDLRKGLTPQSSEVQEDIKSNSILDSYKASMEKARLSI